MSAAAKGPPLPRTEMDDLLLGRLDELIEIEEPEVSDRSMIGMVLTMLILILFSSFVLAGVAILAPHLANELNEQRLHARETVSLQDVFTGALNTRPFISTWLRASAEGGADQLLYEDARDLKLVTLDDSPGTGDNRAKRANADPNGRVLPFKPRNLTTLISVSSLLSSVKYQGYKLSPSKRFLLLWTGRVQQFRLSFTAKYFLYDAELDLIAMLSTKSGKQDGEVDGEGTRRENHYEDLDSASLYLKNSGGGDSTSRVFMGHEFEDQSELFVRFQMAKWFVDSQGRDSLLLAQQNDLYVLTNVAKLGANDGLAAPVRLTHTGKPGVVYNGVPDWLYEEEIMATGAPASEISPTGTHLAYLSFNDTRVSELPIVWYGGDQFAVPRVQQLRYPLAGTPNPVVHLHLIENFAAATQGGSKWMHVALPHELARRQHYLYRIKWLANDKLGVIWSNRHQNESQVLVCKPSWPAATHGGKNWHCERSLTIEAPNGWLNIGDDLHPLDDQHYLALMPKFEGKQVGTFKHLARVSLERPDEFVFLTSGRREVMRIDGLDLDRSLVYYTSTLVDGPGQKHLFVTSLRPRADENGIERTLDTCITCDLDSTAMDAGECLHSDAKLSLTARYFILQCNGPDIPRTELRELVHSAGDNNNNDNNNKSGSAVVTTTSRLVWTIENNAKLREQLDWVKAMPVTVRLRVPIPRTNYSASVLLLLPPLYGPTVSYQRVTEGPVVRTAGSYLPDFGLFPSDIEFDYGTTSSNLEREAKKMRLMASEHRIQDGVERIGQYIEHMSSRGGGNNRQVGGFPMIVEVYGGPSQQKVDYQAAIQVGHYFASSKRTVYAMIDGRGSGKEGSRRQFEMFGQLGKVEVEDQIRVTRELVHGLLAPLVEPKKVAIWGWSYGGYAAAMALARSNMEAMRHAISRGARQSGPVAPLARGVFECAASVAPTTSLIYYDTAYAERYLRSPWKNDKYDKFHMGDHLAINDAPISSESTNNTQAGNEVEFKLLEDLNERYKSSSLLEYIGSIDRKRFLLMHGTGDDNVHMQSSFRLMREMIKKGIPFETRLYPDQRHNIDDLANTMHLHNTLSNFFAECFDMAH